MTTVMVIKMNTSILLRDLAQNEHDDDVMTMGGDGGDDDVNDDAVS